MKTKFRNYAWFQFMSVIALLTLMATIVLLAYAGAHIDKKITDDGFWGNAIVDTIKFVRQEVIGTMASIFIYITMSLWIITWIFGWMIFRTKNRNLMDSLFLMFLMIPIISNMFALFAQLSLKTKDYTPSTIDKKKIKEETEKLIKKEANK